MAQFRFFPWLVIWYIQSEVLTFEWDKGNSIKSLRKHGVTKEEIESVFTLRKAVPIGEQICFLGPTLSGKIMSIAFSLRQNRVRPISGRPASRKERIIYADLHQEVEKVRKN
jgi:uncharacterized DUF497 family protein